MKSDWFEGLGAGQGGKDVLSGSQGLGLASASKKINKMFGIDSADENVGRNFLPEGASPPSRGAGIISLKKIEAYKQTGRTGSGSGQAVETASAMGAEQGAHLCVQLANSCTACVQTVLCVQQGSVGGGGTGQHSVGQK